MMRHLEHDLGHDLGGPYLSLGLPATEPKTLTLPSGLRLLDVASSPVHRGLRLRAGGFRAQALLSYQDAPPAAT